MNETSSFTIDCPICQQELIFYTQTKDLQYQIDNTEYFAYKCDECQILFQYPFWKPTDISRFYPIDYYAHNENVPIPRSIKIIDFFLSKSLSSKMLIFPRKIILPYFKELSTAKNVLDIGCGKGLFLDLMKKYKKVTYGIEPSTGAASIAIKKGHELKDQEFIYRDNKELKFDLITMFQVAEHISVQELIEQKIFTYLYNLLENNGTLIISTPNFDCKFVAKFKSKWRSLELPRHLIIYSPKSIIKILESVGFSVWTYTRLSPIDLIGSCKLKYNNNKMKFMIFAFITILKAVFMPKKYASLLTVVAQRISH